MQLTSPIFTNESTIPEVYGFSGNNVNPPIIIRGVPNNTISLAVIMHDPDAVRGDFLHWIMWNVSPEITAINEGGIPEGAVVGVNDMNQTNYIRPMPPKGTGVHRYIFELFALDARLDLSFDEKRDVIESAIKEHTIEKATLIGLYGREK